MLQQVRGFLEAHGEVRLTWWHRATDDRNAKALQRAGFRCLSAEDGKPLKILKTSYTAGTSKEDKDIYEAMTAIDGEETRVEYFYAARSVPHPDLPRLRLQGSVQGAAAARLPQTHQGP